MFLADIFRSIVNRLRYPECPSEERTYSVSSVHISTVPKPALDSSLVMLSAITTIWKDAGSKVTHLPAATALWHGGTICGVEDIDDGKALWCTRASDEAHHYDGWAREEYSRHSGLHAARLQLATLRAMKMADFSSKSLFKFTVEHCNDKHDTMKEVLRKWCLENGFDGAANINCDPNEVVICRPKQSLEVVASISLSP